MKRSHSQSKRLKNPKLRRSDAFRSVLARMEKRGLRSSGERPSWDWRNHEHKLGFRRDRGCPLRNDSDLGAGVLPLTD